MITNNLIKKLVSFSFARFLVSGGVNTAVTYVAYLLLLKEFSYTVAFSIAYAMGILLAFVMSRYFVFQSHRGATSAILFPFIYAIQYVISLCVIWLWVEKIGFYASLAPLASIVITIPITYVLSKVLFSPPSRKDQL